MRSCARLDAIRWFAAAGLTAGCGPTIRNFSITPRVLCADGSALIDWEASGATEIAVTAEPPPASDPGCAVRGRTTSRYTLIARRFGKESRAAVEVVQLAADSAEPVAFPTSALAGREVLAAGRKDPELWNDRITIATVAACGQRTIAVRHAGREATLAPDGDASAAFAGTALAGRWELRSPLSRAEQDYPRTRPRSLAILATLACQAGAR